LKILYFKQNNCLIHQISGLNRRRKFDSQLIANDYQKQYGCPLKSAANPVPNRFVAVAAAVDSAGFVALVRRGRFVPFPSLWVARSGIAATGGQRR